MNDTISTADQATHIKIVMVALVISIAVAWVAIASL
jgi:hypothetical protein